MMAPLAAIYVAPLNLGEGVSTSEFLVMLWTGLAYAAGVVYLILWLMAEALLLMCRFPLERAAALKLVVGSLVQFAALVWAGDSPFFAAYVSVYLTLTALWGCAILLLAKVGLEKYRSRQLSGRFVALALLAFLMASLPPGLLFPLLWAGYREMEWLSQLLCGVVLLVNVGLIMRNLIDFSIWGRNDTVRLEYDKEWESWAGPTIIVLILSVVTAVVFVGVASA
ncbi:MAG TPA: hypothetical protein DCZ95_05935 [Verrucomicrobia bacterium]|nr:MAG: hypothetical protein A2X46_09785 [Lentisphaerae bacterium GWF2_57_35]HBA83618.1 hypothetical protein [Verrucomicrobiota bacterium]